MPGVAMPVAGRGVVRAVVGAAIIIGGQQGGKTKRRVRRGELHGRNPVCVCDSTLRLHTHTYSRRRAWLPAPNSHAPESEPLRTPGVGSGTPPRAGVKTASPSMRGRWSAGAAALLVLLLGAAPCARARTSETVLTRDDRPLVLIASPFA